MASAEDIAKILAGVIGENDEEATVDSFLDMGYPELNHASSFHWDGGSPVGRMIEIAGPPSSGKTAISTQIMKAAQKQGGIAGFSDHERSFSFELGEKLGLDVKAGRFIYKKPRTFEGSLQTCVVAATLIREKKLIAKTAPIAWVFDSLASMVPQSALMDMKTGKDKSFEDRSMNDNTALARATSAHFPAFAQHCEELGICAVFLNQLRTNIGVMYGDNRKTTGGNAPEFYFSQRLWLSAKDIKKGTDIIGQEVTGVFKKNKVARPKVAATWRFMFQDDGTGRFDVERSTIDFLEKQGILKGTRPGFVTWEGAQIGKDALARKIETEGGFDKLLAMLPKAYEPPVVAEVESDEEAA
jgi:RecA/RadA recombinase